MRTRHRTGIRGFTLVEALVVLTIMGIVLAAAVPSFVGSNRQRRVEGAADEMAARIQVARQRAVASRIPHRLVLEPGSNRYRTEYLDNDSTWVRFPDEDQEVHATVSWQATAGGDVGNTDIEFESRGTVLDEDAPLSVIFTSAGSDTFTLSLVRTGRVTVRAGAP
ncbi:MAG: type II secretion system protein GspH [Candidatus Eisenbacteria bacterium]|nr:type II secretion system protein GspH [Candidatus Latescibacterota bacterium]MBD3302653.1 type II secretion system protein GspH [Candidatus Eisenbacteria bacterium]